MKIEGVIIQQKEMTTPNPVSNQFYCHLTSKNTFVKENVMNHEHI